VTAIIVSYDSQQWLEGSIGTLLAQRYPSFEAIVVDNGSPQDPTPWIRERFPSVQVERLPPGRSFAHAVNHGVALARGTYALVLNPDIELAPDAMAQLVGVAEDDPECAAVASKLTFSWAPAFLNGIGNRVESSSWGTDNFIGHLDLGQYDGVEEVPSVCFAAALIRRSVWDAVGPADEGFPMYYEDVEWSYRARLLGHRIRAAPAASVAHVFGGSVQSGARGELTPFKIRNAAYGRVRFAMKLLSGRSRRRFCVRFFIEDRANALGFLRRRNWAMARAYGRAWARLSADLPSIALAHRRIVAARRVPDHELLLAQRHLPAALMWHGVPDLSRDVIVRHYLPLIATGRTRPVPEIWPSAVSAS
jgi:GT2 family glycosyltransferase